jgi:hypothetical protein
MFDALADDNVRQYTRMDDTKYGTSSYEPPTSMNDSNSSNSHNNGVGGGGDVAMQKVDGMQRSSTSSIIPLEGGALQSPSSAFSTIYFKLNWSICAIFNVGLNLGLGYWGRNDNDVIGLWDTPQPITLDASSSRMALDMTLTSFFVVFFTSLISAGGIKSEVKKGKLAPVPDHSLCLGHFKYIIPLRQRGLWSRAFMMAIFHIIIWLAPWLAFWSMLCQSGILI